MKETINADRVSQKKGPRTLMQRLHRGNGLRFSRRLIWCAGGGAVFLAQGAWASHWYMTGIVREKHGAYIGGFDSDAVRTLSNGRFQATVVTYFLNKPTSMKGVSEIEVDCEGRRYRFTHVDVTDANGVTTETVSKPLDWTRLVGAKLTGDSSSDENKVSLAAFNAVCSRNYAAMIDIGNRPSEKYVQDLQSRKSP